MDRLVKQFIRPFDLSKAPLMRVQLIEIEGHKHVFMLDMHHIISDGTSIGILMKELGSLYDGKTLQEQRVQYKDYSAWKQKQLDEEQSGFMIKQKKYWLDRFKKGTPVLELPLDYQRPSIQKFEGGRIDFELDQELTEKLKDIALKNDATMYMVLLSIYTILLYKYSGQEDIVVGSGTAGRLHADIENTVGMFVNTLPMRNYPGGNKTFTEFLGEVKETALKAYENQDYQFEELVEKLDIKWNPGRNPIFDTTFILQNLNIPQIEMGNLKFIPYKFECNAAKFDITLEALEEDAQISFCLEYRTGLFKKETAQRMAGHLKTVAGEVARNQKIPLSEIEILSKEERKLLLLKYHDGMISINDEELDSGNVAGVLTAEFNL
jgi:bacitracin synthase 3